MPFPSISAPPLLPAEPVRARVICRPVGLAAELVDLLQPDDGEALLFERRDGPSLLITRTAVALEIRGGVAAVEARTAGGRRVLIDLAERFTGRSISHTPDRLELAFPRCDDSDSEVRLKAPSPLDVLRALSTELAAASDAPFPPFCLGVLGFDHVDIFEDLPASANDPAGFPDAVFHLAEAFVVTQPDGSAHACVVDLGDQDDAVQALDDLVRRCELAGVASSTSLPPRVEAHANLDDEGFAALVRKAKDRISAGDIFQVVLSRTFRAACPDPLAAYRRLRAINPSPAMFFLRTGGVTLFGASPETAVRVSREPEGLRVEVTPIAGTRPRGDTPEDDAALAAELLADPKECAEHMMLVDLGRNDVARVSVPGTRRVDRLLQVERFSHVMHLVSRVIGRLRPDLDAVHALTACMNVGTLSGAPKLKATELIRRWEADRRGAYGGAVGWVAADGRLDTAVVIRSAQVVDGTAHVRAGAGVVHDSLPQAEADETRRKAAPVLAALGAAA